MSSFRIFFISSFERNTPRNFYTETPGFYDFKIEYEKKRIENNGTNFVISINSFKIEKKNLIKNKEIDAYDLTVKLKFPGYLFYFIYSKSLSFVEIKNHFIYGFKLDDLNTYLVDGEPPESIILSKKEQLILYMEFLKRVNSEPGDILSCDFCEETIDCIIKDKKFDLDIYLELLQYYKNSKNLFKILDNFEINNCEIPIKFEADKYESILEKIKSNEEMYTKYCFEDGDDNRIKKKFYTLLLYFRLANFKVKPKISIDEEHLWKLFAEIINKNERLYPIVEIPEIGLIKEIMNQKKISYDLIKKIIVSFNSVEQLLSFMEQNYDIIFKNCQEECSNMIERVKFKNQIFKFLEREENEHHINHKKYQIILFNQIRWDYENVILFMINNSIYVCLRNDKKFDVFKEKEKENIRKLKNKQFLKYLSNDIIEYEKQKYGIYIFPEGEKKIELFTFLNIFDGIELKTFEKEDLNEWNKIKDKMFELKDIRYNLEDFDIIKKIKNIDELNKFINLIYNNNDDNDNDNEKDNDNDYNKKKIEVKKNNDYNYEVSYEKKLISFLIEKFLLLISEKISHEKLTSIASILIYKSYNLNLKPENFICSIEKIIDENEINKIYEYLANSYQLTSDELINHMADYIIKKNNIPIIKNLKNIKEKIIPIIFTKIDNFIKEAMVYDNSPINTNFKLLNDMNEEGYSEYAKNNTSNVSEIIKRLESGMVSYNSINSIYSNKEQKELFEKKISVLLFGNECKISALIASIKYYLEENNKNLKILEELKEINEDYYFWKDEFKKTISLIDNVTNAIKKGFQNEKIKAQIKSNLETLIKKYDKNDFHKKYIIKDSLVFKSEFRITGKKQRDIDKIFKIVFDKFNELAILFDNNWQNKINNKTIHNYYDIIEKTKKDRKCKDTSLEEELKKDLEILSNYHNLDIKDSEINKLRDDIIIHINFIDIQSILNEKISYYDSRDTPSNNEFKAKLQNVIEYLKPKDSSENDTTKDTII